MAGLLTDRYRDRLAGVLSCYDRIVITGTLPGACFAEGMTRILKARGIRIFDYATQFAAPLRDGVREAAARLAAAAGITIEHIAKSCIRKEDVVAKVLAARGSHPGLVHVISAMEACDSYQPWHDKQTHRNFLRPDSGNCLHYYFYFMDAKFGLVYLRVPTWCPFRLPFYCNGHSWLGCPLTAAGIDFAMADNAFVRIADWQRAQTLADALSPKDLHRVPDGYAAQCCPVRDVIGQSYHCSLMQLEYSTDLVFRSQARLAPLYEQLARQAVLNVKAEHVATFLGHKITPQLAQEIGSRFATRIEGTCIKHRFGKSAIKMYDKLWTPLPPQDDSAGVDGIGCTNLSGLLMERFALLALMGIRCFWPHKIIGRAGLVVHQAWKLRPLPASHQYSPRILSRPWVQSRSVLHLRELTSGSCILLLAAQQDPGDTCRFIGESYNCPIEAAPGNKRLQPS